VVHLNAGIAALVAAIMYGKRPGFGREPMEPHDITMVVIGAALLWFGWFGFNAGSALGSLGIETDDGGFILTASNAFVVTQIATATAALT
jgi:Amt family ammonium transporter